MEQARIDEAAATLLGNWRSGTRIDSLTADCLPADRAEGYRIADALGRLTGDKVAGWKIAATSAAGQKHINVDGPLAGRIFASRLVPAGGEISLYGNAMLVAEAEFAFAFGEALPPRDKAYERDEVMGAVSALHLSIETPDSRYADFTRVGAPSLIADTACASFLTLGSAVDDRWRKIDLAAHKVAGWKNGVVASEGSGAAVLGDPRIALTWLVNEAAKYGGGVRAGEFVTTGTCIRPIPIAPGDAVVADYGDLGTLSVAYR